MITDGQNGLLVDFFSPEALAAKAVEVLRDPAAFRGLGRTAEAMIAERYSLEAVTPPMLAMYEDAVNARRALPARPEPDLEPDPPPAAQTTKNPFRT
jgi:glycosyltransferase involved in cell wall biosynthesis